MIHNIILILGAPHSNSVFMYFFFFNWNITALQSCASLCGTTKGPSYTYTYQIPPPSGASPRPSHPCRSSEGLSWTPSVLQQLPTSYIFYTWQRIHVNPALPVHPTLLSLCHGHISSLHLCLYFCPAHWFIFTIFLDSIYMR